MKRSTTAMISKKIPNKEVRQLVKILVFICFDLIDLREKFEYHRSS
jgi:hypothetical protein